jgi:hypothetical protein
MPAAAADRRQREDRRSGRDRRQTVVPVPLERRAGTERRRGERRAAQSVADQLRSALTLLTNVAESGTLDEPSLRDLDAAMFRLRFALDRLEGTS